MIIDFISITFAYCLSCMSCSIFIIPLKLPSKCAYVLPT